MANHVQFAWPASMLSLRPQNACLSPVRRDPTLAPGPPVPPKRRSDWSPVPLVDLSNINVWDPWDRNTLFRLRVKRTASVFGVVWTFRLDCRNYVYALYSSIYMDSRALHLQTHHFRSPQRAFGRRIPGSSPTPPKRSAAYMRCALSLAERTRCLERRRRTPRALERRVSTERHHRSLHSSSQFLRVQCSSR